MLAHTALATLGIVALRWLYNCQPDANGLTVIPSDALEDTIVVVDGKQIAANPGQIGLDVTDTPTDGDRSALGSPDRLPVPPAWFFP